MAWEQEVKQPDLQHVNEALLHQQKQMGVLQQVQATSDENHRQAQVARDKELQAHLQTLAPLAELIHDSLQVCVGFPPLTRQHQKVYA